MKTKKRLSILLIVMMIMQYLTPISSAFSEGADIIVNLDNPTLNGQVVELSFDVLYPESFGEIEKIELMKDSELIPITDQVKLKTESSEGETSLKSFTYSDPITEESTKHTYRIQVTVGSQVVTSAPKRMERPS